LEAKVIEDPEVFIIEQLTVELMHQDVNRFGRTKTLDGSLNQFDTPGDVRWEALNTEAGQRRQQRILFHRVHLPGSETSHFCRKNAKPCPALDADGAADPAAVGTDKFQVSARSPVVVVDRNKREEVINLSESTME
jgi:hypothetical protein